MSINSSSGLIGLSLLSGDTSLFASANSSAAATSESLAVRKAKAQFTLAATTPPWKAPASKASDSAQVATVKAMKTIIDATTAQSSTLPDDVKTSFTAYKALDSLRILAQAATSATLSDSQRASIDKSFAKGLADLQTYLGTAPTSKLDLAFAQPTRRGESETLPSLAANSGTVTGSTVATARDAALTGMTGSEQILGRDHIRLQQRHRACRSGGHATAADARFRRRRDQRRDRRDPGEERGRHRRAG